MASGVSDLLEEFQQLAAGNDFSVPVGFGEVLFVAGDNVVGRDGFGAFVEAVVGIVFGDGELPGGRDHGGFGFDKVEQAGDVLGVEVGEFRPAEYFTVFGHHCFRNEQIDLAKSSISSITWACWPEGLRAAEMSTLVSNTIRRRLIGRVV